MNAEKQGGMKRRPTLRFPEEPFVPRHVVLVTYKDGTRGAAMTVGSGGDRWNFACRLKGDPKPLAIAFYSGPWGNWNLFCALSGAIAHFFKTREAPYPVERTLLVSGVLESCLTSKMQDHVRLETPHLNVIYKAPKESQFART